MIKREKIECKLRTVYFWQRKNLADHLHSDTIMKRYKYVVNSGSFDGNNLRRMGVIYPWHMQKPSILLNKFFICEWTGSVHFISCPEILSNIYIYILTFVSQT